MLSIGLFIGDTPLFAPAVYGPEKKRSASASKKPGYFYGEDNGCALLHDLWRVLRTGELIDVEDYIENFFRLIVSPSGPLFAPACAESEWFDVLAIIQHGGSWHSDAMGGSGPAICLSVNRKDLLRFFYDLLDEALTESDDLSRKTLLESFDEALRQRQQLMQA